MKHLKDKTRNVQNRRSRKISMIIFETYKNSVQPNGYHIYNIATDMTTVTIFPCTSKHHGLLHWKCVLSFCEKFPIIVLHSQDSNKETTNTCPTIIFHVYHNFSCCNFHIQHPYHKQTTCPICSTVSISDSTAKSYTRK